MTYKGSKHLHRISGKFFLDKWKRKNLKNINRNWNKVERKIRTKNLNIVLSYKDKYGIENLLVFSTPMTNIKTPKK